MPSIDKAQRVAATTAGVSGLFGFFIVVLANYALLDPLIVPNNAPDTARNFIEHSTQVRVALACFIAYSASVIVLLTALYAVFRPVNRTLAFLAALFRLVFALLWSEAADEPGGARVLGWFRRRLPARRSPVLPKRLAPVQSNTAARLTAGAPRLAGSHFHPVGCASPGKRANSYYRNRMATEARLLLHGNS